MHMVSIVLYTYIGDLSLACDNYSIGTMALSVPAILLDLPRHELETFTGNMLGDGSIRKLNVPQANARYGMTMGVKSHVYLVHLYNTIYAKYSSSGIKAYPNPSLPQHTGKTPTQYHFETKVSPIFTALHAM